MTWRDEARALCDECRSAGLGHGVESAAQNLANALRLGRREFPTWPQDNEPHFLFSLATALSGAAGLALELGAQSHQKQASLLSARAKAMYLRWSQSWEGKRQAEKPRRW